MTATAIISSYAQPSSAALGRYRGDVSLYEHCLPNSLMRQWLEEMRQRRPDTDHGIDPESFGRPDAEITDVLDVHHLRAAREAAIAAHRSQTSPFDGLSDELRHAFLAQDHLARLTPVTG